VRSAILRQTPRVVGDGKRTLTELIAAENKLRESLVFPTLSYPQLNAQNIPEKYLSSDEIVGDKEVREFSQATMIRNGASFYGVLQQIHPSYIALVEQLAAQLNPPFVVVDLMVKEWDKSEATPGSYIFLEFNTSPSLEVYTSLRGGDKPDIIKLLADQVDKYAQLND
jgi:D-alanine-D-alanine ligase-like ATP-grasp enzyme